MLVTALATPWLEGKLHAESYLRLVERQLGHADALLAAGTTAEGMLLSSEERRLLITHTREAAPGVPLWVGVDSPCTRTAALQAKEAAESGANGVLVAPPAFVKCTEEGYVGHINAIAHACGLPVMLYNAPSRCGYVISESAVEALHGVACCIKDAGTDVAYTARMAKLTQVLCGNDALLVPMREQGAVGVVSVVSNVAPALTKRVANGSAKPRDVCLFGELAALCTLEVNPIAVKYMLARLGVFASCEMRLPLTAANSSTRRRIDSIDWEGVQ